jgi:hypothetical protein
VLSRAYAEADAGLATTGESSRFLRQAARRQFGRDSALLRRYFTSMGSGIIGQYLATRDTMLLREFRAAVDTTGSSTWRLAEAHLSLARGDTAQTRNWVDRHFRRPSSAEFTGESGFIRAFAWGDLLSRLGESRLAIDAYTRLDSSDARIQHGGFLVRSWAERGALHQRLGEKEKAVEFYERFIAAWEGADASLQPLVERAREAVRSLNGGVRPVRPRPPGT